MKRTGKVAVAVLLLLGFVFFVGCEEEEVEADHVLVGTWVLDDMVQTTKYLVSADDTSGIGYPAGTVLVDTTIGWAVFQLLGVEATITLKNDFTYNITGTLLESSDTLGVDPTPIPDFVDQGTWEAASDLSTIMLDGSLRDLGGALVLDSETDPTDITVIDPGTETVVIVPTGLSPPYPDYLSVQVDDSSSTTFGFLKEEE